MASILDRVHYPGNLLDRIDAMERRIAELERGTPTGLFPGGGNVLTLPAGLYAVLTTEDLEIIDAGTAAATELGWIEVELDGVPGYLRVYAAV
jgi:hypothetical protein